MNIYRGESPIHGWGCFAAVAIAPGDFIATFTGEPVHDDGTHVLWAEIDGKLVGRRGTSILRYLNHSDTPNAAFDGFDLYATSDIAADTEILINYQPDDA